LILDLLQDVVYINDRQVKEKHIYWHLDPVSPRTDILIEPMEDVAPKKRPPPSVSKVRAKTRGDRACDPEPGE
jgi:hypothetical protein